MVSVIVPALDAEATIGYQLEALSRQTYTGAWEVIVADNGSRDRTRTVVETYEGVLPRLKVIDASDKRGAAHARNVGAAHATGEFLAMCDADDVVDPDWLANLVSEATSGDLVAGRMASLVGGGRGVMGEPMGPVDGGVYRPFGYRPAAPSGNLGIWRKVFDSLGGFCEELRNGEDWDLSWRALDAGYSITYASQALVGWRPRSQLRGVARQHYGYGRGAALLAVRHPSAIDTAGSAILVRLAKVLVRLPYLLLTKRRRAQWTKSAAFTMGLARGCLGFAREDVNGFEALQSRSRLRLGRRD